MMRLAQEMESLGDENPDPKQVGRLMRKMTEIAGERMPEQVEEMVRRLEAGEDPEKLEEEFGDSMDEDFGGMDGPGGTGGDVAGTARKTIKRRPPGRDPALYELADYL